MEAENVRFLELMRTAEWTAAETARRLHMSRGGVSQIVNGLVKPSAQTLALLTRVVAEHKPHALGPTRYPPAEEGVAGADTPEMRAAADQLRELHSDDPDAFKAAASVIETFYRKASKVSSKAKVAAKSLAKTAAERVSAGVPKPLPRSKADDATAKK